MAVTDRIINEKATKQVNEQFESVAKMYFFSWKVGRWHSLGCCLEGASQS